MCERLLPELGWRNAHAVTLVGDYNVATDYGRISAVARSVIAKASPRVGRRVATVRAFAETAPFSPHGTIGFHFNGLFTFDDIAERWVEFGSWVDTTAARLAIPRAAPSTPDSVLVFLGIVTHAVQDFYAHSNWVGLIDLYTPGRLEPEEFPLWEELIDDEGEWRARHPQTDWRSAEARLRSSNLAVRSRETLGGLQTGRVRGESPPGDPWLHRHRFGREKEVVHHLARRASKRWLVRIERTMTRRPGPGRPFRPYLSPPTGGPDQK